MRGQSLTAVSENMLKCNGQLNLRKDDRNRIPRRNNSPLDQFAVYNLTALSAFGSWTKSVNVVTLYSLMPLVLLATYSNASLSTPVLVSLKGTNFIASVLASCMSFVSVTSRSFAALVCFAFIYLAGSNLLGNTPYGYTLATSIPVSLGSSVTLWVWLLILTLSLFGLGTLGQFIPAGTPLMLTPVLAPIESVSYSARAISLGVRLFSNILAGHTLLAILANFLYDGFMGGTIASLIALIAIIPLCCIVGLEIAVSLIQGYVFSVLLVSYIDGAI